MNPRIRTKMSWIRNTCYDVTHFLQYNSSVYRTWQDLLEEMICLLIAEVLNMLFQVLKGPGPLVGVSKYEVTYVDS